MTVKIYNAIRAHPLYPPNPCPIADCIQSLGKLG